MERSCAVCETALPSRQGRGRPASYCSPTCAATARRARQAERLAEDERRDLRAVLAGNPPWWWSGTREYAAQRLADLGS